MKIMNWLKKAGILAVSALFALQPLAVSAEGEGIASNSGISPDGLWQYNIFDEDNISVICRDKTLTHVEVPARINGLTITTIETDCFKDMTSLESVVLPETITHIEDFAFYMCTSLKDINLPNNLRAIDWQAFYGCSSLTEITIPASVETIEEFVFEGCMSLTGVQVSDANKHYKDEDGVLYDIGSTKLIYYPSSKADTHYTLPDTCTEIEDWAFIGNGFLETIDLANVKTIGEQVFYHCTALQSIDIPEGVDTVGYATFYNCTALERVGLPSTLTTVGDYSFFNCMNLREIQIPEAATMIGAYAFFNCPRLSSLTVTKNVTHVGDYAMGFYYNENEEMKIVPGFTIDTTDDTDAFAYAAKHGIKSTGGITEGTVFLYILLGVVAVVIIITIILIIVQRRIQKRYELK